MKKLFCMVLSFLMVLSLCSCGDKSSEEPPASTDDTQTTEPAQSSEDKIIMRVGAIVQENSQGGIAMAQALKPYIEEASNGRIEVELYYNSTLGDARSTAEQCQMGTLECGIFDAPTLGSFCKAVQILDLPFLFKDLDTCHAALDGEFGQMIKDELYEVGLVCALADNGWRDISNNVREIRTPADMKGLKIRVMETPTYMTTMKALGANPTPMSFSELYTGLSQGTVDGQDNGVILSVTAGLPEVLKYYTLVGYCYSAGATVVSRTWYDSLDPELQKVVDEGLVKYTEMERQLQAEMEAAMVEDIKAAGTQVIELTEEEKQQWVEACTAVWPELTKDMDPDLVAAAKTVNEDYGA
ncbi:TRAP transporter substrate-binding protein [uncultured Dysosmobacter sp.]|uniref:TRAP transporter substrate-binding protein n=1 Tax=uncultured Dysosmobacter sp. TaxID=2591384 RepID=UPI002636EF65|nr:TRAP transporter substrate-binding protein [uncultured Dysosmobacter sp.]